MPNPRLTDKTGHRKSVDSHVSDFTDEFVDEVTADPKGHGFTDDPDDVDVEEEEGEEEESEEEEEEEGEEEEGDAEASTGDADDEDLDSLLEDDEDLGDDDADIPPQFFSEEEVEMLSALRDLKDDKQIGNAASATAERFREAVGREAEAGRTLSLIYNDIGRLGLTPSDLQDPRWPEKVAQHFRQRTLEDVRAAGGNVTQPAQHESSPDVPGREGLTDDSMISFGEAKAMLAESQKTHGERLDRIEGTGANARAEKEFGRLFNESWESIPLLRRLSKEPTRGVKLKQRALKSFGSNHAAYLGADGSGQPIRDNLKEFSDLMKDGLVSAREIRGGRRGAKDGASGGGRGKVTPIGTGRTPGQRRKSKVDRPAMTEDVAGRTIKRSVDDMLGEHHDNLMADLGFA